MVAPLAHLLLYHFAHSRFRVRDMDWTLRLHTRDRALITTRAYSSMQPFSTQGAVMTEEVSGARRRRCRSTAPMRVTSPVSHRCDYMTAMIAALARGGTARSIAAMMQITAIKSGIRIRRIGARLSLDG